MVALLLAAMVAVSGSSPSPAAYVLVPVGRSPDISGNRIQVLVNGESLPHAMVSDQFGGVWLRLPRVGADTTVVVRIVVEEPSRPPRSAGDAARGLLSPSELIDSGHPAIVETAARITAATPSAAGKSSAIHDHLESTLTWARYPGQRTDPASTTLALGYGTCTNYARLFVALARASDVPARTVRGIVFDGTRNDRYHEWVEYLDETNLWHSHDPTAGARFDRTGRGYVELMYAAEENSLLADPAFAVVFDATLQPHDGRLGYELIARTPSSITIQNTYHLEIEADDPAS